MNNIGTTKFKKKTLCLTKMLPISVILICVYLDLTYFTDRVCSFCCTSSTIYIIYVYEYIIRQFKLIKTYCWFIQGQEKLSSLGILSIAKIILEDLKMSPEINDKVTEKFVEKERRIDFIYKS